MVWEHIHWGSFLAAIVVILVVPGPDFVLVTSNAVVDRRAGWWTAAGCTSGLLVHAVAATAGLSAVLVAVPTAFVAVKVLGAAYLVYLGASAIVKAGRGASSDGPAAPSVTVRSPRAAFVRGVANNVLNPKVMLLFLTIVPQAMDPGADPVPQAMVLSGTVIALFGLFWVLVVPSVRLLTGWLSRPRPRRLFERGCGAALIAMAATLATA
ncbi:Threonine/homoserine/homoserine lactone efflux protein [Streptoalloteichus tenebrarius]|uniref:Threonine/homoserine/homoserine lactone efflux protein n=1 Tax=Streptoalloteichus tenebrarius (strain ATCC 17920 / DSM 40477 / JCM 4838 / CBS 697.72 / NBRC 16177 / NCIMB 11028 / NRRL B-12390 / A12253. 1 / ISP 5477) TaxID=1933 RepID=A0ABT1HME6_STRSD|nr:LysE family translocator [Streptoalloteichus tenebrarius]MCP2256684.1 Threonine/homoserine/homoserine lactone efflux protein [Streptoalloteichus tenebrarius]BFF00417.1 LysE family translocator [Streptoalloteichus tenebrarius]